MTTPADRYVEAFVRFHRRANRERGTAEPHGGGPPGSIGAVVHAAPVETTEAVDAADAQETAPPAPRGTGGPEPIDWDDKLTHAALAELKEDLYSNLDTLDGKASGLLSYCGLVLAGSAILLDRGGNQISVAVIAFVAVTAAVSAFLGAFVLFVRWSPSEKLERNRTIDACKQYFEVRRWRTGFYLVSWITIVLSTAAFILYLFVSLATGNALRMEASEATAATGAAATEAAKTPPRDPGQPVSDD